MFNKYPYTDFHELNLDWFLSQFKELVADWEDFHATISAEWAAVQQEWTDTKEAWQTLYNYVHDYFDNLDVQEEIDNKLDEMVADGTFMAVVVPYLFPYVTPEMYGAIGDGTTDDTTAIADAISSGACVFFNKTKTYKITSITVPANCHLYGNGATLKGNGTGSLVVAQTYTNEQIHTTMPSIMQDFVLMDADILLDVNKAIKCTFLNLTFKNFNTGIKFQAGYENVFENCRFEGDPTNITAIGLDVAGGGDSIFKSFLGRDVAIAMQVASANNTFIDFHFWLLTQALFDHSVFVRDITNTNVINKYIRFYFDSYKILFEYGGYAHSLIENPTILSNAALIAGESTFIYVMPDVASYVETNLKITNCYFRTTAGALCNISNNTTVPIYMTYYNPDYQPQSAKLLDCNIKNVNGHIQNINASSVFTIATGYTVKSGSVYNDTYNNRVWGDLVIESSSPIYANNTLTIATPILQTQSPINSACYLGSSQWSTNDIGYLYISSSAIQIKANTDGNSFIKFSFDYQY